MSSMNVSKLRIDGIPFNRMEKLIWPKTSKKDYIEKIQAFAEVLFERFKQFLRTAKLETNRSLFLHVLNHIESEKKKNFLYVEEPEVRDMYDTLAKDIIHKDKVLTKLASINYINMVRQSAKDTKNAFGISISTPLGNVTTGIKI